MGDDIVERCPACYPDEDPATYVVAWCGDHTPDRSGLDDSVAVLSPTQSMVQEGGQEGEAWCHLLHRGATMR